MKIAGLWVIKSIILFSFNLILIISNIIHIEGGIDIANINDITWFDNNNKRGNNDIREKKREKENEW